MIKLYLANISDYSNEQYSLFYTETKTVHKQKINAFRKMDDKYRHLLSNYMLRKLLVTYTQKEITIKENMYGKKYLAGNEVYFNISHSGDWVLIGISDFEIGVDIEKIGELDFLELSTFFSKPEQDYLKSLDSGYLMNEFYRIWTAKESYVKFLGKGFSIPLDSFIVPLNKNNGTIFQLSRESQKNPEIMSFFLKNYSISICSESLNSVSLNYYNVISGVSTLIK